MRALILDRLRNLHRAALAPMPAKISSPGVTSLTAGHATWTGQVSGDSVQSRFYAQWNFFSADGWQVAGVKQLALYPSVAVLGRVCTMQFLQQLRCVQPIETIVLDIQAHSVG